LLFKDPAKDRKMGRAAAGSEVAHSKRFGLYGVDDLSQEGGKTIYFQWLTGELAATVTCTKKTSNWSLSEDGKTLALLHPQEEMVEILDIEQRRILAEFKAPKNSARLAVAPGGELLAVGGDELVLFNLTLGKVVGRVEDFEQPVTRVRFTPQQDLLLVGTQDGQVLSYMMDPLIKMDQALPEPQVLSHGADVSVEHVQLSGDGRSLVTVGSDSTLRLWAR
jgi:WD40 repeat protein